MTSERYLTPYRLHIFILLFTSRDQTDMREIEDFSWCKSRNMQDSQDGEDGDDAMAQAHPRMKYACDQPTMDQVLGEDKKRRSGKLDDLKLTQDTSI